MTRTHAQVEAEITTAREAELAADEAGDAAGVERHIAEMNKLLDEWTHIPQQRPPTAGS